MRTKCFKLKQKPLLRYVFAEYIAISVPSLTAARPQKINNFNCDYYKDDYYIYNNHNRDNRRRKWTR